MPIALLVPVGMIVAGAYALIALLRAVFSRPRAPIQFIDLLLVFMAVLLPFSALVLAGLDGEPDSQVGVLAALTALGLAGGGLVIALIELLRPPRLRGSRGLLMFGGGLLLGVSALIVPFLSVYLALPNAIASGGPASVGVATPAPAPAQTLNPTQAAEATQAYFRPIAEQLFADIFEIVGRETGLGVDAVLTELDNGRSIAQLVEANAGDVDGVVSDITARFRETVLTLTQQGVIPRGQSALLLSQLEFFVRLSVENDIRTLLTRFGGEGATPDATAVAAATGTGTPESLFAFLTVTATPTGSPALIQPSATATLPPTLTPTATRTTTPSRTPRPSATPTLTRTPFTRSTVTSTPTLAAICALMMDFNVNLRATPDLDAELLATIPFETVLVGFGRDAEAEWWFVEYDGLAGWVKGEFVTPSAACADLPVRR